MNQSPEEFTEFSICLDGDVAEVDIETLVVTLTAISGLAEDAAVAVAPGAPLRLLVRAPRKGSFLVQLSLLLEKGASRFATSVSSEGCQAFGTILGAAGGSDISVEEGSGKGATPRGGCPG